MNLDQIQYINTLDKETINALQYYSSIGHVKMNKQMNDKKITSSIHKYIQLIDNAFKNAPPTIKPMIVYRGIKSQKYIDTSFTSNTYVSTTIDKNVALEFQKKYPCCLFEIVIPTGSHILPLMYISTLPHESEILLSRDSEYKILKQSGSLIKLEYIEKLENNKLSKVIASPVIFKQVNYKRLANPSYNLEDNVRLNVDASNVGKELDFKILVKYKNSINELVLNDNKLSSLPDSIKEFKKLTTLSLNNNKLQCLPKSIVELKSLEKLLLSDNQLKEIPTNIDELTKLQVLGLGNNQLEKLPTSIGNLKNLMYLNVTNNKLVSLPPKIKDMKQLKYLMID